MPRICCITASGLRIVRAIEGCGVAIGDDLHGVCAVLDRIFETDMEVEKGARDGL